MVFHLRIFVYFRGQGSCNHGLHEEEEEGSRLMMLLLLLLLLAVVTLLLPLCASWTLSLCSPLSPL